METKDLRFLLLSDLYRIIGTYSMRDFQAASRLPHVTNSLRRVIELLAREGRRESRMLYRELGESANVEVTSRNATAIGMSPNYVSALSQFEDYVVARLSNKRQFPRRSDLLDFAQALGVSLEYSSKDSRSRVIARFARTLRDSNDQIRKRVLDLLSAGQDQQTKGWFDVIRRS